MRRLDVHGAHEIRAARSAAQRDALDRQIGFRRQHVREEASHFDSWRESLDPYGVGAAVFEIPTNRGFEGVRGSRLCQNELELAQNADPPNRVF
jgi:hypothetical protein